MQSPKLASGSEKSTSWYRYYAGYSAGFVEDVLDSLGIPLGSDKTVLDPWNGSGTTTYVAHQRGHSARGFDANPALVVIGKSRLLGGEVIGSLDALTDEIIGHCSAPGLLHSAGEDPLESWFEPSSASQIRSLERTIHRILVGNRAEVAEVRRLSSLAAFFYVVLFQTTRAFFSPYLTSNPTWVKRPKVADRSEIAKSALHDEFRATQRRLMRNLELPYETLYTRDDQAVVIDVALSRALPLEAESIDAVITSPPYCTRIDYVVAFLPELAILGYHWKDLKSLRDEMIGTPTILKSTPPIGERWGSRALQLLEQVKQHTSVASSTYYLKYFTQYLSSMAQSLQELRRVSRPGGPCAMIVQDSYYKDIHIDLPEILQEMAINIGWTPQARQDFAVVRTKASMNPRARRYRSSFEAIESAIVLKA